MADLIECRNCDSLYCEGCNIYTLAKMLHKGKFDSLMDDEHSVNEILEAEPVKHGKYITDWLGDVSCSLCGAKWLDITQNYCPNCGAKMTEGE